MASATPEAALVVRGWVRSRREWRSWRVRRAWPLLPKSIRSASQWPGVAGSGSVVSLLGPQGEGLTQVDEGNRAATFTSPIAPLGLGPGQEMAPGVVLPAVNLGLDEAVDGLVGDEGSASFPSQATGDLLWRPTALKATKNRVAQVSVPVQFGTAPATSPGLVVGVSRVVALLTGAVPVQLPRNCRCRAIHTCRDLAPGVSRGV